MIRDMQICDIKAALKLGEDMRKRSRFSAYPIHHGRSVFVLSDLIASPSVYTRVYDDDGLQGVLVGEVTTDFFVDLDKAGTIFFYANSIMALLRLVKDFENWAAGRAHMISVDVSGGVDDERLAGVLKNRAGLAPAGGRMIKEFNYGC